MKKVYSLALQQFEQRLTPLPSLCFPCPVRTMMMILSWWQELQPRTCHQLFGDALCAKPQQNVSTGNHYRLPPPPSHLSSGSTTSTTPHHSPTRQETKRIIVAGRTTLVVETYMYAKNNKYRFSPISFRPSLLATGPATS